MKTMVIREYGRATQVSKSLFGDEPFPPKEGDDVSPHMKAALDVINADFNRYKAEHFPQWEEPPDLTEGPLFSSLTIIRKDGEPVPDDVYDAWSAWYFWNEYDADSLTPQPPTFVYPEEYTTKTNYYRQFAWYAQVPTWEVNDGLDED